MPSDLALCQRIIVADPGYGRDQKSRPDVRFIGLLGQEVKLALLWNQDANRRWRHFWADGQYIGYEGVDGNGR